MKSALMRPAGDSGGLLAIDPGEHTGLAYFEKGTLRKAWAHRNAYAKIDWRWECYEVIVEIPRVYPHSPVDPNDLIKLSTLAGFLAARADAEHVWIVHPSDWKGQTPKKIDNARTLRQLSDNERRLLGDRPDHNVLDAVGIGLWALGRKGR